MLVASLDDDQLLGLYRTLPPGSDLLDGVHKEIMRRGEHNWERIESMFFKEDVEVYHRPDRRSSLRFRCR